VGKPRLRHIALFASDPKRVAQFYKNVFDMEIVRVSPTANAYFVSDGHINLAILPHSTEGQATRGLNHLGFQVDDQDEIARRIEAEGVAGPKKRPADRPYAEQRGADPEGNMFDISVRGFQTIAEAS
jgi:catechol 2,3-dioxygenase-like lactoylglutathione lyase family enzyme